MPHAGNRGWPRLAIFFIISLLVPIILYLGPLRLQAHRLFLLVMFLPLLSMLVNGRGGKLITPTISSVAPLSGRLWLSSPRRRALQPSSPSASISSSFSAPTWSDGWRSARPRISAASCDLLLGHHRPDSIRGGRIDFTPGLSARAHPDGPWCHDPGSRLGLRRAQTVFAHPILFGASVSTALGMCWYALKPAASFTTRVTLPFRSPLRCSSLSPQAPSCPLSFRPAL